MPFAFITRKALPALAAAAMVASTLASAASAMPLPEPAGAADVSSPVQDVQYRYYGGGYYHPYYRPYYRPYYHPYARRCWRNAYGYVRCRY